MTLDLRESVLRKLAGCLKIATVAQRPGLPRQSGGQLRRIGERPVQPKGAVEVIERCRVMAGDRLQPTQTPEAVCLLAGIAEASEDRQCLRIGATSIFRPAELAVDHAERGGRDGPPAGPGRTQSQGLFERLLGHT